MSSSKTQHSHLMLILRVSACLFLFAGRMMWTEAAPSLAAGPDTSSESVRGSFVLEEDVSSVDSIIKALYESITFAEGGNPDWTRFRNLYSSPDTPCIRIGGGQVREMTLETFINFFQGRITSGEFKSFFEEEISREVEHFGSIAQVFSTYRKGTSPDNPESFVRGINSLQLYLKGKRWLIASILWQDESKDEPIPEKYLKK